MPKTINNKKATKEDRLQSGQNNQQKCWRLPLTDRNEFGACISFGQLNSKKGKNKPN